MSLYTWKSSPAFRGLSVIATPILYVSSGNALSIVLPPLYRLMLPPMFLWKRSLSDFTGLGRDVDAVAAAATGCLVVDGFRRGVEPPCWFPISMASKYIWLVKTPPEWLCMTYYAGIVCLLLLNDIFQVTVHPRFHLSCPVAEWNTYYSLQICACVIFTWRVTACNVVSETFDIFSFRNRIWRNIMEFPANVRHRRARGILFWCYLFYFLYLLIKW